MTHKKVIEGLAVTTVSVATAGVAQADVVTSTPKSDATTLETQPEAEVLQEEVAEAKAAYDQAQEGVNNQETVVNESQNAKDQAQLALGNATIAVSEAQELANQASPETIAQAKEGVTETTQNVTNAQIQLEETQATANTAQEALASQETIVNNNQATIANAQKEVDDAKEAVGVANQAIDETSAQTDLATAQSDLTAKTNHVKEAQEQLEKAKTADEAFVAKRQEVQADLDQKALSKTKTETLLKQVVTDIANEQVSTSVQDHAYYNQRDAIWTSYYGNGSFAATGCVPTSLAMVFTELARRGITPTEIADYLYDNTNYFNKTFSGTSANGIVAATQHFGFVLTQLSSQSSIIQALQAGHHVIGAVQNNKFSPWGPGYSHEIVMRGYSNGNTYIYDPYNRANIGWYPVASLWAEQSQDKDDRALGAPFFKITTQKMAELEAKMAELEAQKVKASSAVQTASRQLADAKATLTKLQSIALRVPGAQEVLNQATADLSQAEANVLKTQEAVRLESQELAQKETTLKEAQAELSLKETALSDAKEVLVASQAKLETLKATATAAEEAVSQAKETLETAKQALTQQETRLAGLEEAPARLAKAQETLMVAKADLAQKTEALKQAQAELETLKTLVSEAQTHYMTVLRAYQANLTKVHYTQLKTDYQKVVSDGGQMVPVVDETGKVTGIINGTPSHQVKTSTEARSQASTATANRPLVSHSDDALPKTGEASSSIEMIGVSLISLLGLVGLKRKA